MKKTLAVLPLLIALSACQSATPAPTETAPAPGPATFVYAPKVGRSYQHTMTRFEEVAVVGAPLRNSEEWEMVWDITCLSCSWTPKVRWSTFGRPRASPRL